MLRVAPLIACMRLLLIKTSGLTVSVDERTSLEIKPLLTIVFAEPPLKLPLVTEPKPRTVAPEAIVSVESVAAAVLRAMLRRVAAVGHVD